MNPCKDPVVLCREEYRLWAEEITDQILVILQRKNC